MNHVQDESQALAPTMGSKKTKGRKKLKQKIRGLAPRGPLSRATKQDSGEQKKKRRWWLDDASSVSSATSFSSEATPGDQSTNSESQSFCEFLIEYVEKHPGSIPPPEIVQERIDHDYDACRLRHTAFSISETNEPNSLPSHLSAAQDLLEEYIHFHRQVAGRTRKVGRAGARDYGVVELLSPKKRRQIFQALQDFLRPRILFTSAHGRNSSKKITPTEVAQLLTCMHRCVEKIATCPDLDLTHWRKDLNSLLQCYIDLTVRGPCQELLSPLSLGSTEDLSLDSYGHAVTGHPERMISSIRQQMTVAKTTLPRDDAQQVWAAWYQELSNEMVANLMLNIETSWKSIHSARYCSTINDSVRFADLFEELLDEYPLDEPHRAHADALLGDLAELSMHAVTFLCHRILQDLQEDLTSTGTTKWASDGGVAECIETTLNDYFSDFEGWLADEVYFYPKILKTCFDLVQQIYVESFFNNTMAEGVSDPAMVAKALGRDFRAFDLYFKSEHFVDYLGHASYYSEKELQAHLGVLGSLAHIMNPRMEPADLSNSFQTILHAFGSSGEPVVLHLAGLRGGGHGDWAEWVQALDRASQMEEDVAAEVSDGEESSSSSNGRSRSDTKSSSKNIKPLDYNLPDVRNSKFIRNKPLDPQEIARRVSEQRVQAARFLLNLLPQRPGIAAARRRAGKKNIGSKK